MVDDAGNQRLAMSMPAQSQSLLGEIPAHVDIFLVFIQFSLVRTRASLMHARCGSQLKDIRAQKHHAADIMILCRSTCSNHQLFSKFRYKDTSTKTSCTRINFLSIPINAIINQLPPDNRQHTTHILRVTSIIRGPGSRLVAVLIVSDASARQ